jgi:hypothetical protein
VRPRLRHAVAVAAALAAWACSSSPPTAILYLVVRGEGQVAVARSKNPAACVGNACSTGNADAGALEIPYAADTPVGLQAQPSPGWQFTSWQVAISGSSASTTSMQPILDIENTGNGMSVLATFTEAGAPTDAGPPRDAGLPGD